MLKKDNPQTYRDLALRFYLAALREPRKSSAAKFNNEQGDAWRIFAERLESKQAISKFGHYTFNGSVRSLP